MTVYILQFDRPLGNPEKARGQARYYIGYCAFHRFEDRMKEHLTGNGAAITRAAVDRGIGFKVIAKFWGGRDLERRFKNVKNTPKLIRKLKKEGRLLGMCPLSLNQQAIMSRMMELGFTYQDYLYDNFDGRAVNGLIRRGLLMPCMEDGRRYLQITKTGLTAVTGEI